MTDKNILPYGKQQINEDDIQAVCDVLRSDWLTTGPKIPEFEKKVAKFAGVKHGVAVNSGTAALHTAMNAIGISSGDEVIVPSMTFAATANAVVYQKGQPLFVDVVPDTLLIDPEEVEKKITKKTKAIIAVDYAGQMCDYDILKKNAKKHNLILIADACHSLGGLYHDKPSGSCADMSIFSFHPVKHITTGEGGMVLTDNDEFASKMAKFRNHGITRDANERQLLDSWYYEIEELGFNYRLTDFQCALGISQLGKLNSWIEKRGKIAKLYDDFFKSNPFITPLSKKENIKHAYHLYVVKVDFNKIGFTKQEIFSVFKKKGVNLNVHYIPVHLHPFYMRTMNTYKGLCPVSENAYEQIFSLPIFPEMDIKDVNRVCEIFSNMMP